MIFFNNTKNLNISKISCVYVFNIYFLYFLLYTFIIDRIWFLDNCNEILHILFYFCYIIIFWLNIIFSAYPLFVLRFLASYFPLIAKVIIPREAGGCVNCCTIAQTFQSQQQSPRRIATCRAKDYFPFPQPFSQGGLTNEADKTVHASSRNSRDINKRLPAG